ncbi:phosphoribosylanthranilate isomerase [Hydrocarboniclastica marina]|uniref:N-(5'-phosphoribosyl)anthranilate isomerase n=1 Tax=Hydrocarboniclastica marina TaxID=2259620 RepID=A0A4P7XGR3_9ALTE|nr:phosphoribosylanthranilate isomerase [Hydrocarboniclastica marina]QCF26208.1 phosphoribosylanthranilate isomerase [Hydrocarboniclastica marina]
MSRTRIKICGITRPEDAAAATALGADALGLVFYEQSPRSVTIGQALSICRAVSPFVSLVGLFVNPRAEYVRQVLAAVPLGWLQFHGDESEAFCEQFERPYIKAIRVRSADCVAVGYQQFRTAAGLLVDAFDPGLYGGTGQVFNWALLPDERPSPLVLAGGLTPDNVAQAVRQVRPWAVDVSGGVEAAKGVKDPEKIRHFIEGVLSAHEND